MSRFRLGVAARVVSHSLLLLALVAASAVLIDRCILRPAMRRHAQELTAWLATQAAEHRDEPARLAGELAAMHRALPDGDALLRQGPPPLPLDFAATLLIAAIVVVAVAAVPLTRSLLRPLRELLRATRAYADGDSAARVHLRRNDEFGDLAFAFNEMVAHVESLRRAEKQLLANVSHELRTPLARVRVLLELASDGAPDDSRHVLPEIAQDLGELEGLVDDVLTTARLDLSTGHTRGGGELPMHFCDDETQRLVQRWSDRFLRQQPARQLLVHCAEPLPLLRCDPVLLRRAVDNLLDNAARYSPPEQPVELTVATYGDRLHIEVSDRGPGIAAADLRRVFEPFYRVEQSRDRRHGGVGLGLALAKRIIEAHAGTLTLQSTPHSGTRATVEVPLTGAGRS
jgi:two-component system OmpR family sensor kinase